MFAVFMYIFTLCDNLLIWVLLYFFFLRIFSFCLFYFGGIYFFFRSDCFFFFLFSSELRKTKTKIHFSLHYFRCITIIYLFIHLVFSLHSFYCSFFFSCFLFFARKQGSFSRMLATTYFAAELSNHRVMVPLSKEEETM